MVRFRFLQIGGALALVLVLLTGCESKQNKAIDAAKKQAMSSGQTQQVVTVDKAGDTTTTTIQPPAPGQPTETITTTTVPASATAPGTPLPRPGTYYRPVGSAQPSSAAPQSESASQPQSGSQSASAPQSVPAPVVRPEDVRIPAGSELAIRINQTISVKRTPAGARFSGEIVDPWTDSRGRVILPKGTPVGGVVDVSHKRGHFKGESELELRLTSLTLNGTRYALTSHDTTEVKRGKGKRSAAMIGGGAGLGMLIGGLASGGKGALIGGLAGAGAGTAGAGMTGNRDIVIPAESIVHFRLADALTLQE